MRSRGADYCIITLVHGTFARDAAWTRAGSPLREALSAALGRNVDFHVFAWSGRNSHRMRLKAGLELEADLARMIHDQPDCKHFVVAHSHGGNVTLYALRNPTLQEKVAGIVTLGTPFICCEDRDLEAIDDVLAFASVPVFLAGLVLLSMGAVGVWNLPPVLRFLVFVPLAVALWICFIMTVFLFDRLLENFLSRINSRILRHQAKTRTELQPPAVETPMLCIQMVADEAKLALAGIARIGDVPFRMASPIQRIITWNGHIFIALSMLLLVPYMLSHGHYVYLLVFRLYVYPWLLLSIVFVLLPWIAPWFPKVRHVAFGAESVAQTLFTRIGVREVPPKGGEHATVTAYAPASMPRTSAAPLEWIRRLASLRHSTVYENPNVLRDVGEWIRQRARAAS